MLLTLSCSGTLENVRTRRVLPGAMCADTPHSIEPLRRLSHEEFVASLTAVSRVFGEPTRPIRLAADRSDRGLLNQSVNLFVSPSLSDQYYEATRNVANGVAVGMRIRAGTLQRFAGCSTEDLACGLAFVRRFARLAYRHALSAQESERVEAFFRANFPEHEFFPSIVLSVQAALLSPSFLYHVENGEREIRPGVFALTPDELANRLSFALWGEPPDDALRLVAESRRLLEPAVLEQQARRLLGTRDRAERNFVAWHWQWLGMERLGSVNKDPGPYPRWSESMRESMIEEFRRFIGFVYFEADGSLQTLLTSRVGYVDSNLAEIYAIDARDWQRTRLPAERMGVFSRPGFLAANGHPVHGSPVLRGNTILDRILCEPLTLPAGTPLNLAEISATVRTNRERYSAHTQNPACQSCHERIDGLGFPFEAFDSIGRFRQTDNELPVDTSGQLAADHPVANAQDLLRDLAADARVKHCVSSEVFRFVRGRPASADAGDVCSVQAIEDALTQERGDIREALIALVLTPGFRERRVR